MAKRSDEDVEVGKVEAAPPPTRDELRNKIFSAEYTEVKKEYLTFNGVEIELRQPKVSAFMEQREGENREFFARFLIDNAYIPYTDEKVFDVADRDSLLEMPMNSSWTNAINAIQVLIDIKVDDKVKN